MWAAQFASDPAIGRPAVLPFARDVRASLVYVDDVAELFVRVLEAPSPLHAIYNSGGDNVSLFDLEICVRELIPDAEYTFGSGQLNLPYWVDSTRAESEFDWKRHPLPERVCDHIVMARAAQGY
jgi:UDP-glucose 4-epimerase